MSRPNSILNLATVVVFVAIAAAALLIGIDGPTVPLPLHFNAGGGVDRWGTREDVGRLLAVLGLIGFVIAVGIALAVRRQPSDSSRARGLRVGQAVVLIAFAGCAALIVWTSLAAPGAQPPAGATMAGLSLLFTAVGAVLGRVGPNPVVGVRTPWSYKSRPAWDRSNRLAGRLFFFGGLVGVVTAPFAPQPLGLSVLFLGVLIAAGWSVFESWRVWRGDPDRQSF